MANELCMGRQERRNQDRIREDCWRFTNITGEYVDQATERPTATDAALDRLPKCLCRDEEGKVQLRKEYDNG